MTPEASIADRFDVFLLDLDGLPPDMLPMHPQWIADATAGGDRPAVR